MSTQNSIPSPAVVGHIIQFFSVKQLAEILGISPDSVVRKFSRLKGVVDLGSRGSLNKRRYRFLRFPRYLIERIVGPITHDKEGLK